MPSQLAHHAWGLPRLGVPGHWYFAHETGMDDVLQVLLTRVLGDDAGSTLLGRHARFR
jgi:hypothetical protein